MIEKDHNSQVLRFIPLFSLLSALEALANAIYLMSLPADPKNALIFGYSLPRLVIILGLLVLLIISLGLAFFSRRRPDRVSFFAGKLAQNRRLFHSVLIFAGIIFIIGWVAVFTPDIYYGQYSSYFTRIRPGLIWLTLLAVQTAIFLLLWERERQGLQNVDLYRQDRKTVLLSGILLVCFLGIWVFIALSRVGLTPDLFWGKTGVPLLNLQILSALLIGLLFLALLHKYQSQSPIKTRQFLSGWKIDLLICLVLWLAATFFWIREPLSHNHFAPGPYPPNNAVYPYSDAAVYDLTAQFAIIGQGFSGFRGHIDKPLYSAFLVFLHVVMGQSYQRVIALQVVFLAILPAMLYLIGRQLFNRSAGVIVGGLAIFKGINSIAGMLVIWDVSNPKMMMSEYPLAVALVLFTLLMVVWLKDPERRYRYLMAAGGVIGLATLVRNNSWIMVGAAWLVILIVYWRRWKKWLRASLLFTIVLVISILPWMWQSAQAKHNPFYFLTPLRGVVLNNRYLPYLPTPATSLPSPTKTPLPAGEMATPVVASQPSGPSAPGRVRSTATFFQSLKSFTFPIADNFLHDLVTSVLTLPSSFQNENLWNLVRQEQPSSFWNTIWDGRMNPTQGFLVFLDMILLAIGIASCWRRWNLAGLMPLITYLAYSLGTAVARTSGGRYIVPLDWVVYFYYGFGLLQVVLWGAAFFGRQIVADPVNCSTEKGAQPDQPRVGLFNWRSFAVLAGFFAIGTLVPLSQYLFPRVYPILSKPAIVQMLADKGAIAKTSYSLVELQQFAAGKNNIVAYGRGLYPRYLDFKNDDKANEVGSGLSRSKNYLVFDLVGPGGLFPSALQMSTAPAYFPNASEVAVIGCKSGSFVYPFAVVILAPQLTVYSQNSALPDICPSK
ncbi:MAG TPA: glycosyltransferase family 39 protein [Anaerolineaceae bacterium]|nr:glycosyltransferase family 39 protein [Anaerolineaceae bacterium]